HIKGLNGQRFHLPSRGASHCPGRGCGLIAGRGRARAPAPSAASPPSARGANASQPPTESALKYAVKEMFKTLQGEGGQTGRAAVFCRFAGCNLWNGRESDRGSATCSFCDTDFVGTDGPGGARFRTPAELAGAIADTWGRGAEGRFVVFTGGEPLLQ